MLIERNIPFPGILKLGSFHNSPLPERPPFVGIDVQH